MVIEGLHRRLLRTAMALVDPVDELAIRQHKRVWLLSEPAVLKIRSQRPAHFFKLRFSVEGWVGQIVVAHNVEGGSAVEIVLA